jgi:hypothetical protein
MMAAGFKITLIGDAGEVIPFEEGMRFEVRGSYPETFVIWVMPPGEGGQPLVVLPNETWRHEGMVLPRTLIHFLELNGWRLIQSQARRDRSGSRNPDRIVLEYIIKKVN